MEMLNSHLKDEGYQYTAEQLAGMPEGVPVPLHNAEHPEKNCTVEFRRIRLPKDRYRGFSETGQADRNFVWPREPSHPQTESPAETEACTAVIVRDRPGNFATHSDDTKNVQVLCAVHLCSLEKSGVYPVAWADQMHSGIWVTDLDAPKGVKPVQASFGAGAFPVLNLAYMSGNKAMAWAWYWLEPVAAGDGGPAFSKVPPHLPPARR
jgi:hypothetical protein